MHRDASHLWRSFSHNMTKIIIQFLNNAMISISMKLQYGMWRLAILHISSKILHQKNKKQNFIS